MLSTARKIAVLMGIVHNNTIQEGRLGVFGTHRWICQQLEQCPSGLS